MTHSVDHQEPHLYPYVGYLDRPKLTWPGGARLAFWVAPNIEVYELHPPHGPHRPPWLRPDPDILGYSERDYGNRTGVWRMMEVMAKHSVRGSVSLSVAVCDHYPEVIEACNALGWEFFSHGVYNTRFINGMSADQEREIIRDSARTIMAHTGQKLCGWLGPSLSCSRTIANNLAAEGVQYTLDLFHDDQPMPLEVDIGRLISIPYSWVVNDAALLQVGGMPPGAYADVLKRQFDQLYEEGATNPTVMCMPIHPYLIGQPNRIGSLDAVLAHVKAHSNVWFPTAREIAAWYYERHYENVLSTLRNMAGTDVAT